MKQKTVVIGGGVIGVCCALSLLDKGHDVVLIEPDELGEGAASSSCGSIAVSEIIPLSKPRILLKAPKWLIDPSGVLSIRPSSLLAILPWFFKFALNSRSSRIHSISKGLGNLTARAYDDYVSLFRAFNLHGLIGDQPVLQLYDTLAEFDAERDNMQRRRDLGFDVQEISGAKAVEMEPSIANDFAKALVFGDWRTIADPKRFVTAMSDAFLAHKGKIEKAKVKGFTRNHNRLESVCLEDGGSITADQFVLAAGAWTKPLARLLNIKLDIEAVAGYQTIFPDPGFEMKHGIIYAEGGFGMTPYESGVAIAGSIEFLSLDSKPNYSRAKTLVQKARRVLPKLNNKQGIERMGRRPLTPDTLPVIDRAPTAGNVFLASGHGQLGVTLGATTGKLIAQLIAGEIPGIDLTPYRASRF